MAKKNGGVNFQSPLYVSGRTNGPAAGPKGGLSIPDPRGALSKRGLPAPGAKGK